MREKKNFLYYFSCVSFSASKTTRGWVEILSSLLFFVFLHILFAYSIFSFLIIIAHYVILCIQKTKHTSAHTKADLVFLHIMLYCSSLFLIFASCQPSTKQLCLLLWLYSIRIHQSRSARVMLSEHRFHKLEPLLAGSSLSSQIQSRCDP